SLLKVREKEGLATLHQEAHVAGRVRSIIELKESIDSNRENLKALQARDASFKKKRDSAELLERNRVLREGGNPQQVLLRRKKKEKFEKEKLEFEAKQKVNRTEIVSSILKEKENIERRKKQQELKPIPKPSIHTKIELTKDDKPVFLQQEKYMQQSIQEREIDSVSSSSVQDVPQSSSAVTIRKKPVVADDSEDEEDLAQPEFEGMWGQGHKAYKVPKEEAGLKPIGGTKMEHEIMKKTLAKHRDGIIVQQVAAGREFKGKPFNSKPDVIHFKNLDVGKTYKKKIVITNVSYSINFCKLSGLSEHLKDFVTIDFEPPGQMSAGMSCDMFVTFKPMINEDLSGEVFFLAQTGPFSIPLKCSTKKCEFSVDVATIDFGSQVVGETIHRSVVASEQRGARIKVRTTADTPGMTPNDVSERLKTSTTVPLNTALKSRRTLQSEGWNLIVVSLVLDHGSTYFSSGNPQTAEFSSLKISEFPVEGAEEQESDIHVQIMSGDIEAFSSIRLDIIFTPCIPGDIRANFRISFTDPDSEPIVIKASAVAIDVPVWLERQNVDLKICMYDRLYQEQIIVH
uniref:Abnormal spindle-like microcephaly-associated protein ASH domain-containing protein n=1 Tax=Ciona savignyi TaxID=51511 RepID=H2YXK3_CIOSA